MVAGAPVSRSSRSCRSAQSLNAGKPVVPLRCTTGCRLPSLWLGEIDTTDGNMRFIKIKLALMG